MSRGMYEGAHPTAPGGMSRKALITELIEEHDYEKGTKAEWDEVSWPDLINLVVEGRKEKEAEAEEMAGPETPDEYDGAEMDVESMFDDESEPDDEDWFDNEAIKVAEFHAAYAGGSTKIADMLPDDDNTTDPAPFDEDSMLDPETMFASMTAEREEFLAANPPLFLGIPGVRDYVFDGHAGAGPSGAERWMNCTMALTAARAFLETLTINQQHAYAESSTAARQGTTAHAVGEAKANFQLGRIDETELDITLLELAANPIEGEDYDEEMERYVTEYTDLVKGYADDRGNEAILIESRVEAVIPLSGAHEDENYVIRGSVDFAATPTKKHPSLVVGDLKYGEGKDVDVDENPQIRLYALGIIETLADDDGMLPASLEEVEYYIVQPRLGGIKKWSESVEDLLAWRDDVLSPELTKALYGEAEGATYNPSELACQWCPARGTCPALATVRMEAATEMFDIVADHEIDESTLPETHLIDSADLARYMEQIRPLVKLYSEFREEAQRRLHRGESVPGFWLVNYTPKRSWKPGAEEKIREILDIKTVATLHTEPTLVSPTQAEKLLGREVYPQVEALVEKPDKRPVISTGASDKRSKWTGKEPEAMFADETDTVVD